MFGGSRSNKQSEATPFDPKKPLWCGKVVRIYTTTNYREAHGICASTGILFDHESPLRGLSFVTRNITDAVARIELGLTSNLALGNLDARRYWGYAKRILLRAFCARFSETLRVTTYRVRTLHDCSGFHIHGLQSDWYRSRMAGSRERGDWLLRPHWKCLWCALTAAFPFHRGQPPLWRFQQSIFGARLAT